MHGSVDDIFGRHGGLDMGSGSGQDPVGGSVHSSLSGSIDNHLEQLAAARMPDPTATPSRTLLVRNVTADASEDELTSIFKVRNWVGGIRGAAVCIA